MKSTSSEISLKAKFAFDWNSFYLSFKIDKLIGFATSGAAQISSNFVPGYSTMMSVICLHLRSDFSMF